MQSYYPNLTFTIGNIEFTLMKTIRGNYSDSICSHTHSKHIYEIYYIISGDGFMLYDNTKYHFSGGSMGITGPSVSHAHFPLAGEVIENYGLTLSIKELDSLPASSESIIGTTLLNTDYWIGNACESAGYFFEQIYLESSKTSAGSETNLLGLCLQLMVHLVRNVENPSATSTPACHADLNDNRPLIIDNLFFQHSKDITPEMIARELKCSPRQVNRFLNEHYHKSFVKLKLDFRMAQAVTKLYDPNKKIREISEELGFPTYEYFSKTFKQYYKLSPSEYRKKLIQNE